MGTYTASDADGDTVTLSLSGTDAGDFNFSNGVLTFKSSPDYENPVDSNTNNIYIVTVNASDGRGGTDSHSVTITVTDVNERPVVASQIGDQTLTVGGGSTTIGLSNKFSDPDGDTLSYAASSSQTSVVTESVSGSTLTIAPVGDGTGTVTVTATDTGNLNVSQSFTVTVLADSGGNTPPEIAGPSTVSYAENGTAAVATYTDSDADGDTVTLSLSGTDVGDFNFSNGVLTFKSSPNYESPVDADRDNEYLVTVNADDGHGGTVGIDVTIVVSNVDEPGSVTLSTSKPQVGTRIAATLSDPDVVASTWWKWERRPSSGTWSIIVQGTRFYTPVSADQGNRLRATARYTDGHGSGKSASVATAEVTSGKLAIPSGFSLNPLAYEKSGKRTVRLSWKGDENASEYAVEIRASGQTWDSPHSEAVSAPFLEIDLDRVLPDKGMADVPYEYELQVKATYSSDAYEDSEYSKTVTITNSPIIAVNGDSRDTYDADGNPTGKVKITWRAVADPDGNEIATGYEVRWVKLPGDHTMSKGPDVDSWSIGPIDEESWTSVTLGTGDRDYTLMGLDLYQIYAIQINYTTAGGPGFSGQEFYVWPSDRPAGNGELVATYPLRNYVTSRTYSYYVCDESFSDDEDTRRDWTSLVNHALGRWVSATNGLIQMAQLTVDDSVESGICYDFRDPETETYIVD